jgi:hypothetical protein
MSRPGKDIVTVLSIEYSPIHPIKLTEHVAIPSSSRMFGAALT